MRSSNVWKQIGNNIHNTKIAQRMQRVLMRKKMIATIMCLFYSCATIRRCSLWLAIISVGWKQVWKIKRQYNMLRIHIFDFKKWILQKEIRIKRHSWWLFIKKVFVCVSQNFDSSIQYNTIVYECTYARGLSLSFVRREPRANVHWNAGNQTMMLSVLCGSGRAQFKHRNTG